MSLLDQVMGRKAVNEDVPVPCAALSRRVYQDRLKRLNQQQDDNNGTSEDDMAKKDAKETDESADLRAVLGEAENQSIIPDSAERLDGIDRSTTTAIKPVKFKASEPVPPADTKEKYLTPYAALTAPDATPEALTPIDPARVPNTSAKNTFTWSELAKAQPATAATPGAEIKGDTNSALDAMDVLLGRSRKVSGPAAPAPVPSPSVPKTEEEALAAMHMQAPVINEGIAASAAVKAAAALCVSGGSGENMMPPPVQATNTRVNYDIARKWL